MLPPGATSTNIENRVKDKTESFVYLKKDIDEIEFDIETKKIKSEKQIKLLRFLFENEGMEAMFEVKVEKIPGIVAINNGLKI